MSLGRRAFWASWAVWLLPLLLFRVGLTLQPWQGEPLPTRVWASGLGLLGDALVAFEAVLLLLLVRRAETRLRVGAAVALFIAVQAYLLTDLLLFTGTGVRMSAKLLYFVGSARELYDSAQAIGLSRLAVGVVTLAGLAVVVLRRPYGGVEAPSVGPRELAAAGVALVGALAASAGPSRYFASNALWADQLELARSLVGLEDDLGAGDVALPPDLVPKNERFERISPRYPLLKDTRGFTGEEAFSFRLGDARRPHVVFLFLESFRAKDVGVLGGRYGASPEFDRLSREGVLFRSFYNNGVQTTRAVLAALFGLYDRFAPRPVQSAMPDLPLIGLPHVLRRAGYRTAYFHNGSLDFERKRDFFPAQGYEEVYGVEHVSAAAKIGERTSWGVHDEHLMPFVLDWLSERDRRAEPSFVTMFTVSHHHPWTPPSHHQAPVGVPEGNPEYASYLRTFHYADRCLGQFVDELRRRGLAERTVLVVLGDHAQPMGEHGGNFMLIRNLYEENLRIPLLLLADGRVTPAAIDELGSEVDLVPTIMDLLELGGPNHAVGSSLRRRTPDRAVFFSNPFGVGWLGLRQGAEKHVSELRTGQRLSFDLDADPDETANRASADREAADRAHARTLAVHRFVAELIEARRLAPPVGERTSLAGR